MRAVYVFSLMEYLHHEDLSLNRSAALRAAY